jgi:hypothetical protein
VIFRGGTSPFGYLFGLLCGIRPGPGLGHRERVASRERFDERASSSTLVNAPLLHLSSSRENSSLVADVSTVTLLAAIVERNRSAFDVNVEPSPVTAPE